MAAVDPPPLESGLVFVVDPDRGAIQRLVLGATVNGETLWIGAGGVAETCRCARRPPSTERTIHEREKRELIREEGVDEFERTTLGYRFATDDFDTMDYCQHGWWQTTIPSRVDLFGVAPEDDVFEITAEMIAAP